MSVTPPSVPSATIMRPQISFSFLIILSFVLCASADSRVALEGPLDAKWTEFMSFLDPAQITNKIHEASFFSNSVVGHHLQSDESVSPDSGYSRLDLRQSLDALEAGKIIQSLETLGIALHNVLQSGSSDIHSAPLSPLLKNLAKLVVAARDDVRTRFPFPATAPGHAAREKSVSDALEHLQRRFVRLARGHESEQKVIECYMARVIPFFRDISVLIGDVSELYPAAIEALVLNLSAVLLPEAAFLRSLVILYCLGPYVLGKDAISGWLLKHVSDLKL